MIGRTRKEQKREDWVLSSGLHGMWFSDVLELYDTSTKRSLQTVLAGWRRTERLHCTIVIEVPTTYLDGAHA